MKFHIEKSDYWKNDSQEMKALTMSVEDRNKIHVLKGEALFIKFTCIRKRIENVPILSSLLGCIFLTINLIDKMADK